VDAGLADHVVDECHLVDDAAEGGDGFRERLAALALGFEFPDGLEPWAEAVLKGFDGFAEVAGFPIVLDEGGFEVEEVEVAGSACHEELDHTLGASELGRARCGGSLCVGVAGAEAGECDASEAEAGLPEEIAPARAREGGVLGVVEGGGVHGWISRRRRIR
jgi:hypothetical protein